MLLLCAVLLALVGMGTREVRDPHTNRLINDPVKVEEKLSTAESGVFYVVIYTIMISVILVTRHRVWWHWYRGIGFGYYPSLYYLNHVSGCGELCVRTERSCVHGNKIK